MAPGTGREVPTVELDVLRNRSSGPGPDAEGIARAETRLILEHLDGRSRVVAELRAQGYTTAEIATLTNQTSKAVETRLRRIRIKLRKEAIA